MKFWFYSLFPALKFLSSNGVHVEKLFPLNFKWGLKSISTHQFWQRFFQLALESQGLTTEISVTKKISLESKQLMLSNVSTFFSLLTQSIKKTFLIEKSMFIKFFHATIFQIVPCLSYIILKLNSCKKKREKFSLTHKTLQFSAHESAS